METKTENKKQQWKNSISSSSSSRSLSISSDSSDGHFELRHFPLPKPTLSASEVQKQREYHHNYNSSLSSYTGSSWSSIRQNNLVDFPSYDPNRIPSSVFSSKPGNSTEWSIASNESLFSIHDTSFFISTIEDHGLPAALRLEGTVNEITEINPVPLPPVKKPNETITEETYQVEISDSEIDDKEEEEMTEIESEDDHEEEKQEMIKAEVLVETEKPKVKEVEGAAKEKKPEASSSIVSHSTSISCRSVTSNTSIGSFAFPLLHKEDADSQTPSMIFRKNVPHKQSHVYQLPQSPIQPPQPQPYSEESQPQSQRKASKRFKSRTRWFSCFYCPSNCGIFK